MAQRPMTLTSENRAEIMASMDWQKIRSQTDAEIEAQDAVDPDAVTISEREGLALRVQCVRRTTGLSQPKFAERFRIPVATLRDWEQARREPDAAALAYLRVIERNPQAVADALVDAM